MNNIRRKILVGVSGCGVGLLLPPMVTAAPNVKENSNSCSIHPETLNIIHKYYGKALLTKTDDIKFYENNKMLNEDIVMADNPYVLPFTIKFDPTVVHQPITFIMQRFHTYYHDSVYVAQYKTNGNVSRISFRASVPDLRGKTEVKMFAVSKTGTSVVYACRRVNVYHGDEGCC